MLKSSTIVFNWYFLENIKPNRNGKATVVTGDGICYKEHRDEPCPLPSLTGTVLVLPAHLAMAMVMFTLLTLEGTRGKTTASSEVTEDPRLEICGPEAGGRGRGMEIYGGI